MKKLTPKLNTDRRFPTNMMTAHALCLKAKNGEKGNQKGKRYAVPAFNITHFQGINAAFKAFELLGSSGLLAVSNSALKHFGEGDAIYGLEVASDYIAKKAARSSVRIATHLDHGDYISEAGRSIVQASVQHLTSVMADNSTDKVAKKAMPLQDNADLTREVVDMAHPLGLSVEGELGVLAGEEDEDTKSEFSTYTNPDELDQFLRHSGVLMLAPTIGTMHGPNKGKPGSKVKLNIKLAHELLAVADKINSEITFVAHGASTLYPEVVKYAVEQLDKMNDPTNSKQKWLDFVGTDWDQIEGLIEAGFCKINTDTENRQTYLSALLGAITETSSKIDIRWYDNQCTEALTKSYIQKLIMAGNYGVWHDPKIDVKKYQFDLSKSLSDLI